MNTIIDRMYEMFEVLYAIPEALWFLITDVIWPICQVFGCLLLGLLWLAVCLGIIALILGFIGACLGIH